MDAISLPLVGLWKEGRGDSWWDDRENSQRSLNQRCFLPFQPPILYYIIRDDTNDHGDRLVLFSARRRENLRLPKIRRVFWSVGVTVWPDRDSIIPPVGYFVIFFVS